MGPAPRSFRARLCGPVDTSVMFLLLLASATAITVAFSALRTGDDGLSLHHPQAHCQWYVVVVVVVVVVIVIFRAPIAFRKSLQQRPKMIALAHRWASTKLQRTVYMRWTDGSLTKAPHFGVSTQDKVKFPKRDGTPDDVACELYDEGV
jgi:hypothetical protein